MCHSRRSLSQFQHWATGALFPLTLLLLVPMTGVAWGAPISLRVDPILVDQPRVVGFFEFDFPFGDELNGTVLTGQSLSLDFAFSDGILARVLGGEENDLAIDVLLIIRTNANTFPGFAGDDATGFLLAEGGSPLHAQLGPDRVGRATSSAGEFGVGLFPPIRNFDMAGVHYDLALPTTGYQIIGGKIRLASNSQSTSVQFGTAIQLPEGDMPWWFLALILGSLMCIRFRPPVI